MTAQQLIEQLAKVVADYGPEIRVEVRNAAGDLDEPDILDSVVIGVNWQGVSVVRIDPSA
jgi:hypothetical protein